MKYMSKLEVLKNGLIRLYEYEKPLTCFESTPRVDYTKDVEEHKESDTIKSLNRVRNNIKNLIDNNICQYSKFITLTYKIAELDRKQVLKDFNRFCDRFEYFYHERPRYVAILEHQKERGKKEHNEGSYHIHMILFNEFKINLNDFDRVVWKKGICNTQKVDSTANLGRYLMKYITKDMIIQDKLFNKKSILHSNNLRVVEPIYNNCHISDEVEKNFGVVTTYKKSYAIKYSLKDKEGNNIVVDNSCTMTEYKRV